MRLNQDGRKVVQMFCAGGFLKLGLLCAAIAVFDTHFNVAASSEFRDLEVEIRGSKLHFEIYEGSDAVVLLESGATYGVNEWRGLAADLAKETGATIISYDRAGMGGSDHLDTEFDIHEEVARLHGALYILGLHDELVLAGHSFGGYMIQLYSNLYPESIRGLVYIDSNTVSGLDMYGGPGIVAEGMIEAYDVESPTKEQQSNLRLAKGYAASHEMMRRYPALCDTAIVIVTAGREAEDGVSATALQGWRDGQTELSRFSNAEQIIARHSGHMVPFDDPEIVVSAIKRVLELSAENPSKARLATPGKGCNE